MTEHSDEDLVALFRETGDPGHFERLVERHAVRIRAIVLGMVLSDADADDITQEVFMRAARGLSGFRAGAAFTTWLYRIAMNTTRSFLRAKARRGRLVQDGGTAVQYVAARSADRPDRRAVATELGEQIEQALDNLPQVLRAALVLTVLEGVEVAEAARVEGCARATMYWRVHRARQLLRTALSERTVT